MKNKKQIWILDIFLSWVTIVIMSGVSAYYARLSAVSVLSFSLFQIFAILIPGLGYTKILYKDKCISRIEFIFISYVLGYSSNIVMYYLLFLFGGVENASWGYFILIGFQCVISLFLLFRDKSGYYERNGNWYIPIIFISLIFALELFAYGGYNLLPPFTDGSQIWSDVLYWIGNTVSLKLDYPPINFRTLEENYAYHYFSSMQLAVESIVTGIPVAELSIYFSYIQAIIIIVGGVYCLLKRYTDRTISICIFSFMLLFTSGYEGITRVSYVSHMYLSQYGFDYGMGYMLFLLVALMDFWNQPFSWRNYFFTCIMFGLLVGIKATFACVGIVGIGWGCLHFLLKKDLKKSVLFGLSILFLFILLYLNVCNISGYSGGKEIVKLSMYHWDVCENLASIRQIIFEYDFLPVFLLEIIFGLLFVVICNPSLFILVLFSVIAKVLSKEKFDYIDICCFIMMIVGMSITLYIHMNGKSNIYFGMATYPIALLFIIRTIEKKMYNHNYIPVVLLIILNIFGFNLFLNHSAYNPIRSYYEIGKERYSDIKYTELIDESLYGISEYEYEALMYIKDEIDEDEVVISINNREDNRNIPGIFSERRVLNVNYDEISYLEKYTTKWNVKYLIVSNKLAAEMKLESHMIYENEQWCIVNIE